MQETLSLSHLRRSAAELMACAVVDLYPGVQLIEAGISEFGFFYDFFAEQPIDDHALPLIEEKMRGLVKGAQEVKCMEMMRENAASFLSHHGQPLAAQRALQSRENIISLFQLGSFHDLCPTPFIQSTSEVGGFKLLNVEKLEKIVDENEIVVTRIFGTSASDPQSLKNLIKTLNQAKKRCHAALGEKLGLFELNPEISHESYLFTGKGVQLRDRLVSFLTQKYEKQGFKTLNLFPFVLDDLLARAGSFQSSGEEFSPGYETNEASYGLPCSLTPIHLGFFVSKRLKSSDLPMKLFQWNYVSNLKRDFFLGGLHQSATIYAEQGSVLCRTEQVKEEVISSLQFIEKIVKIFKFEGYWTLNGKARKQQASSMRWKKGVETLKEAFETSQIAFKELFTEELAKGPLAELRLIDSLGREWRGPSISFDFDGVDRFDLRYRGDDKEMVKPVLLVTKVFGSIERFLAILLEHDPGALTNLLSTATTESNLTEKEVNA